MHVMKKNLPEVWQAAAYCQKPASPSRCQSGDNQRINKYFPQTEKRTGSSEVKPNTIPVYKRKKKLFQISIAFPRIREMRKDHAFMSTFKTNNNTKTQKTTETCGDQTTENFDDKQRKSRK